MNTGGVDRRRALALAGIALVSGGSGADAQSPAPRLPPVATTHHTIDLPGRSLKFEATAGALVLTGDKNEPRAELAFVAYQLEGADRVHRPITFAFNGGPGFASAWLNVCVVGPWRIAIGGEANAPSASPEPEPNAETWLDFTDLVFIDPAGTGWSRASSNPEARRQLWSINGDIEYLAEAVRMWLDRFDRNTSPKYLLGESYGGYRAPRLTRELADKQGTGISGLVLLSPALDFGGRSAVFDPLGHAARLPSMTAAARAAQGAVTRAQLADVEEYARTEFLMDAARGESDPRAIARRVARVAQFTGLDLAVVQRYHGLLDPDVFLHELDRKQRRVGSIYDATISSPDPFPLEALSDFPDPVLDGLKAPVSSAMVAICETRLNWRPETTYLLGNAEVHNQWDWGHRFWDPPQAAKAMLMALALDPHLSVLVTHGMFDLVTPYLGTQFLLDQVPEGGFSDRIHFSVYPGGHMFYTDDHSRALLRDEAARLFGR